MSVIVFVLTAIILLESTKCDDITRCVGGFCFTIPGQTASYNDANSWCQSKGSMLASVYDDRTRIALTQFLDSTQINSAIFLQFKVFKGGNGWYWLNGTPFSDMSDDQKPRESVYRFYGYLSSGYLVYSSNPNINNSLICEFNASECQTQPTGVSFSSNGRCYVKYDSESLSWFKARMRCINEGGDLAILQKADALFPSGLFNNQLYWLGLRYNNWTWKYSYPSDGTSREMIYTNWSSNEPNNYTNECVCVDPHGNPKWSWSDCDCNIPRLFACLSVIVVNETMTSTTFSSTFSFASTSLTSTAHNEPSVIPADSQNNAINKAALTVGLVLGIGVNLPLLIILVVLSIIICRLKQQPRDKKKSNSNPIHKRHTSNELPHAMTSHKETVDPGLQYESLKSEGPSGASTGIGTYEQLRHQDNSN